jgi:selenocysteine lyase/cysteine desulfurase
VPATCRASCGLYTTEAELRALGEALDRVRAYFERGARATERA